MSAELSTERQIHEFAVAQWGEKPASWIGLKLGEEAGEVAGAIVRDEEGRGTRVQIEDEIGDVLIVLSQLASQLGTTLEVLRTRRFGFIQRRMAEKKRAKT